MAAARPLTRGETVLARALFADAVDYARVRIHGEAFLPFGLQPADTALAPNGEIWFSETRYLDDFSASGHADICWFIHEMTHVWQYQLGYPVLLRGALRLFLDYRYELSDKRRLADYNMEAQGDLLADYFALRHLGDAGAMRQQDYAGALPLFERVLQGFIADPSQRAHLPAGGRLWLPFRK